MLLLSHPLPPTSSKESPKKRKRKEKRKEPGLSSEDIPYTLSNLLYGLSSRAEVAADGSRSEDTDDGGWLSRFCEQVIAPL